MHAKTDPGQKIDAQSLRVPHDGPADAPGLGAWLGGNPADQLPQLPPSRLIIYSGWLGEQDAAAEGVFEADFQTWGPSGRAALESMLAALAEASLANTEARVCFRPHARHLLSDPQACLNMLRERGAAGGAGPFEVLLEPAAFLTPEMIQAADDHIARAIEALADRADVPAVLLSDCERVENPDKPGASELRLVPPGRGILGAARMNQIAEAAAAHNKALFRLA